MNEQSQCIDEPSYDVVLSFEEELSHEPQSFYEQQYSYEQQASYEQQPSYEEVLSIESQPSNVEGPSYTLAPKDEPTVPFDFTNHDLLSGFNNTVRGWLRDADIPIVSAPLTSEFTLADAQQEGMLFGRSLAYLITESVIKLNIYYPTIGELPIETEDSLCNSLLPKVSDWQEFKVDERFWRLG